jgi:hypothetical protein
MSKSLSTLKNREVVTFYSIFLVTLIYRFRASISANAFWNYCSLGFK